MGDPSCPMTNHLRGLPPRSATPNGVGEVGHFPCDWAFRPSPPAPGHPSGLCTWAWPPGRTCPGSPCRPLRPPAPDPLWALRLAVLAPPPPRLPLRPAVLSSLCPRPPLGAQPLSLTAPLSFPGPGCFPIENRSIDGSMPWCPPVCPRPREQSPPVRPCFLPRPGSWRAPRHSRRPAPSRPARAAPSRRGRWAPGARAQRPHPRHSPQCTRTHIESRSGMVS